MCQFFAVTPFSFSLTEPHERNYVNQINPCKMLQPLGVWGETSVHVIFFKRQPKIPKLHNNDLWVGKL